MLFSFPRASTDATVHSFFSFFIPSSSSLPPPPLLPDRRKLSLPLSLSEDLTCLGRCKVYVWKTVFDAWRVVVDQGMDNVAVGKNWKRLLN